MVPPGTIPLFPAAPGPLLSLPKFAPGSPGPLSPGVPHGQALTVSPEADRQTLLAATAAAVWRVRGRQAGARGRSPGRVGATPLLRGCRSNSDSPSGTCRERQTGSLAALCHPPPAPIHFMGSPGRPPAGGGQTSRAGPRPLPAARPGHALPAVKSGATPQGRCNAPWSRPIPNRSSSFAAEPRPAPRG